MRKHRFGIAGAAIADYDRVIAQGPAAIRGTSVCGHRMLAYHDGWHVSVFLDLATGGTESGCKTGGGGSQP